MNSIAAGMESDFTDSDVDIVYTESSVKQPKPKQDDCEFVPVSKTEISPHNFKNQITSTSNHFSNGARYQKRNNFQRYSNGPKSNWKPSVVRNSVALDDLRYAVMQGNLEVVKSIMETKGICVDSILKAGWTPLMYASSAAHPDIVLYLLENKADPNYHRDMYTALMAVCASSKDDEENLLTSCKHLLKFGADVNTHERHLMTPLMFAAREGHLKIVTELVNAEANIFKRDNRGRTALSWAAFSGHGMVARFLVGQGADPQEVDVAGQNSSDLARQSGHEEVATMLERLSQQKSELNDELHHESLSKTSRELLKSLTLNSAEKPREKYCERQGELELFLNGIGLSSFISVFKDQQVSFNDLLIMNDEELEKVGINQVGVRKKIVEASKAAHKKDWENSSLPNFSKYQYISCPDAVAMMANIAKHLKFISTSVVYIRSQIQSQPRILEIAQETASVHDLLDEMDDSLVNIKNLDDELKFFRLHLKRLQGDARYVPGDMIVERVPAQNSTAKRLVVVAAVSIFVGGILWKKPETLSNISSFVQSHLSFTMTGRT